MKARPNMTILFAGFRGSPDVPAPGSNGGVGESSVPGTFRVRLPAHRNCSGRLPMLQAALRIGALTAVAATAAGATASERFPITPQQREVAEKVAANGVAISDLAPGAPASYRIKSGDTLWSIASLFLKSPWRWPELWGMNRNQVQNPHLIYPNQTLVLVRTPEGRAQLVLSGGAPPEAAAASAPAAAAPETGAAMAAAMASPAPVVRLSPRAREIAPGSAAAIPSIPNRVIEPFLSRPMIVTAQELEKYARIVGTPEDRVYLGAGDLAYARGIPVEDNGVSSFHVFRPAAPIFDPDDVDRRTPIAFEAMYLGTARLTKRGEVATLRIVESKQEIGVEDRLVPIDHQEMLAYVPRRPEKDVAGRIVSVYEGVDAAGAGNIVTLNRGRADGLEIGSVLAVLHNGETIVDRTDPKKSTVKLPDEGIGHVFVFRLFEHVSYALLVSASGPIVVGDRIGPPEAAPVATAVSNAAMR